MNSTPSHWKFQRIAGIFSKVYSSRLNPLYHLGSLAILMFLIACVTGVYLFMFYDLDPANAYHSVQQVSANPIHGIVRSMHRYSSDLLVIFIVLHFTQTLLTGKYKRAISWVSGIVSFLIVLIIGVTGFILVWDEKGKLVGYLTAKFFTVLPIFDPSIAGSFISNNLDYIGGFFKVSLFGHVFFSFFLIIVMWLHVLRIAKPKLFPAKELWIYSGIALLVTCVVFPVQSDGSAQESFIPYNTSFDWYYFFGYSLMRFLSVPANWAVMIISGVLFALVPFVVRKKKKEPVAIDLDKCDACNRCAEDCPYGAIDMLIYKGERKAILDADKCISCGICVASCKERAITLDTYPDLFTCLQSPKKQLAVFSCSQFAPVAIPDSISSDTHRVTCLGDVHAKDIEKILDEQAEGVLLLGCEDCYHRYGKEWEINRIQRKRPPVLSKRADLNRIQIVTTNHYSPETVQAFVGSFNQANPAEPATLRVLDYFKPNHIAATAIFCLFFLAMPLLSNTQLSFFDKSEKMLVLNFKYVSSPTEYMKVGSSARQMQYGKPVVAKRSPIRVQVWNGKGQLLLSKDYNPRGLRQDIAIFVYNEIKTNAEAATIRVSELAFTDKTKELKNIRLNTNDGTIVAMQNDQLTVLQKK